MVPLYSPTYLAIMQNRAFSACTSKAMQPACSNLLANNFSIFESAMEILKKDLSALKEKKSSSLTTRIEFVLFLGFESIKKKLTSSRL